MWDSKVAPRTFYIQSANKVFLLFNNMGDTRVCWWADFRFDFISSTRCSVRGLGQRGWSDSVHQIYSARSSPRADEDAENRTLVIIASPPHPAPPTVSALASEQTVRTSPAPLRLAPPSFACEIKNGPYPARSLLTPIRRGREGAVGRDVKFGSKGRDFPFPALAVAVIHHPTA